MTDESIQPEPETSPEAPVAVSTPSVPGNPALVEWPRDEWGFCSELRAALLRSAQQVRGNDEKMKVFTDTVKTGILHAMARMQSDKDALQAELEREAARVASMNANQRVAGYSL